MQTLSQHLQWQLDHLPHQPGVYLMKNRQGAILYIGKAMVLSERVHSYFQRSSDASPKTRSMVDQVEAIETIVTGTELEALLLENNLIKKYRPKYNIILRDDKQYPLLRLPMNDDYPRLSVVRRFKKDGALYFGPYIPSNGLYEMLKQLRRLFPLPNCTIEINGLAERPCIEFEIKRCMAPCTGRQSKTDYHEMMEKVRLFLEGKDDRLLTTLHQEMNLQAALLNFEEAAQIRDQIARIKRALERQRITAADREDQDLFAMIRQDQTIAVSVLFIRNGMMLGKQEFCVEVIETLSDAETIANILQQFYDKERLIPGKIVLSIAPAGQETLTAWMTQKCGHVVHIVCPSRGEGRRLIDLAMDNAKLALETRVEAGQQQGNVALTGLQSLLHLSRFPHRIEGYDISNISGTSAVGAMVVFEDGLPKKADYRHFKIKTIDGANDFGMMAEMLTRRFQEHPEEDNTECSLPFKERLGGDGVGDQQDAPRTPSQASLSMPDLIVIDGGKGQICAVRNILEQFALREDCTIDLIGLAKERAIAGEERPERVYLPDVSEPIALPVGLPATYLLMRIRDEAHRFAIMHHRKLRAKKLLQSPLETITGIGKKRRLALLRHFGSLARLRGASLEEIESVPTLNKKIAQQLFDALSRGEHS